MNNKKCLSIEQGEKLNEILKEYNLKESSIDSVRIWFVNSSIYRDINHLSKKEIFKLFNKLRYDQLFISNGKSIMCVELIVDANINKFSIKIDLCKP
mgnify:FL=1|jgi:hypothetical protein